MSVTHSNAIVIMLPHRRNTAKPKQSKKRPAAEYNYPQQTAHKDGVGDGIWTRDFQDHNLAL